MSKPKPLPILAPTIVAIVHRCQRFNCQHQWKQHGPTTPKQCPGCHSYDWQTPTRAPIKHECVCGHKWSQKGQVKPSKCPRCKKLINQPKENK